MKCAALCSVLFLFMAPVASAQEPVRSFADLPSRVQKGEHIKVKLRDGTTIGGRFDGASGSSLRLIPSGNTVREIPGATVTEIRKRRPDSVWNGVLIGAAAGVAAGLIGTAAMCKNDSECSAIVTLAFVPTFGAGGAGIGALADHLIHKDDPIYLGTAHLDRPRIRVAPLVSHNRKGVLISMSF
jgi:hypothetical protein